MENAKFTYFQYHTTLDLPIFVRAQLDHFEPSLVAFLEKMKFSQVSEENENKLWDDMATAPNARLLTIKEASYPVMKQIDNSIESDRFGPESIVPKEGYKVYRFKNIGLMVYSLGAKEWELGCHTDFGSEEILLASQSVVNRFLSWSLAPMGIIGFWGVPVDEGVVILKQRESFGEAVYVDVAKRKIISVDGVSRLPNRFKLLRLDPNLRNRNIRMNAEELLSFLSIHTTYMNPNGLSIPIRQMLQTVSRRGEGLIHPKESFKPRTDLAL